MKFRIHGTWPDGTEDSLVVEADTIEEVRELAVNEADQREWIKRWSEEL